MLNGWERNRYYGPVDKLKEMPFWYGIIIIVTVIMTVKSNTKRNDYMNKEYGYGRISTGEQNVERQVRSILAAYPFAIIVKEIFTGTKSGGRKGLDKILSKFKQEIRLYLIHFPGCPGMQRKVFLYMRNYLPRESTLCF